MRTMTLINDEQGLFFTTDAGTEKMAQLKANLAPSSSSN